MLVLNSISVHCLILRDGSSEWEDSVLEDMLYMYCMDHHSKWGDYTKIKLGFNDGYLRYFFMMVNNYHNMWNRWWFLRADK